MTGSPEETTDHRPPRANRPVKAGSAPAGSRSAPAAWPVAGHAPSLIRRPLPFVRSLAAHGDIVRIRLGPLPVYALTHPALVQRVLVDDARNYARGRIFEKAGPFLGEGLLVSAYTFTSPPAYG
ncbi:hypothetical protein SAVIM338S_00891 [Streptomyces avidinii]